MDNVSAGHDDDGPAGFTEDPDMLEAAAILLAAMANPKRLQMLILLSRGEMSVGDLTSRVGLSQSAASQHLAKLRKSGLVRTRRNSQSILYICDNEMVAKILASLDDLQLT